MSQTEKMPDCTCVFVKAGKPMNTDGCLVHDQDHYVCGRCPLTCFDYRPTSESYMGHWAVCVCGHIAQDHN